MQSMARMKELKPELDRINEMYKDDREKKGAAIMELYRKRGVNPMAGCFPVLLQMPIWFSLYASLSSNVELFRAPFALWWTDLSSPDAFFILPLALGVLMFVQQKISPATGVDPVQQKMMLYMMPAMITSFMLFLPSGLCLYMLTNSALSIGQQRLIEARLRAGSAPAQ
jgi:YidC/Oxa1 family membrane protein insertase